MWSSGARSPAPVSPATAVDRAPLEIASADGSAGVREFVRVPDRLHAGSPWHVPQLSFERRRFLDRARNPFFAHAEAAYLIARRGGRAVGRVAAHLDRAWDGVHGPGTGFFGFFECAEDQEAAAALLAAAEGWLRGRGATRAIGPMSFTTNHEVGAIVKGFEGVPYIMMPWNPPYYEGLLGACGYRKERDLLAYLVRWEGEVPPFVARIAARARRSARITVRTLELKRFREELELVKRIYNEAWSRNWGFVPMSDAEIEDMARELRPLLDPQLVYFVFVDGEPAGFFLGVPDYNLLLHRIRGRLLPFGFLHLLLGRRRIHRLRVLTMGVVERWRNLGLESVMIEEVYRRGPGRGFVEGELSWILEDNRPMNAIATRLCGPPYRTYRVFGKDL